MAAVRPLVVKAGRVRMLPASDSLDWSWLSGIPAPLALWAGINPAEKANTAHAHAIDDVTGLQAALGLLAPMASPTFSGIVGTTGTAFLIKTGAEVIQGRMQHNGTNLYVASDVGDLYLRPAGYGTAANQLWLQAGAATTEPGIIGSGNIHVAKGNAFISVGAAADHVGGGIANFNSVGNQPQLGVFAGNGSGNAGMIYLRPDGRGSAVGQSTFSTTAASIGTDLAVTGIIHSTGDMRVTGADVGFRSMPTTGRQVKFGSNNSSNSGIYNMTDSTWMLRWNASNVADLYGTQFRLVSSGSEFYRARANSASMDRQPRIFIRSSDPGAAAAPGDLWGW